MLCAAFSACKLCSVWLLLPSPVCCCHCSLMCKGCVFSMRCPAGVHTEFTSHAAVFDVCSVVLHVGPVGCGLSHH